MRLKLLLLCVTLAVIAAGVMSFAYAQREIGRRDVLLTQEHARQDTLTRALVQQQEVIRLARERVARANSAAAHAVAQAQELEGKFAAVTARLDSAYAQQPDSTRVPLGELRIVQVTATRAIQACTASRDSVQEALRASQTVCAAEAIRADLAEQTTASVRRSMALIRPAPPAGRGVVLGAVLGAVGLWLAQRLGGSTP